LVLRIKVTLSTILNAIQDVPQPHFGVQLVDRHKVLGFALRLPLTLRARIRTMPTLFFTCFLGGFHDV